jgi:hypothetical protein
MIRGTFLSAQDRRTLIALAAAQAFFDRCTGRRFESLCWRDAAALDAPSRRLYGAGIRPRLRKPFGTDRAVASAWGSNITKPDAVARKLAVAKQKDFIESYDKLLNFLGDDEAVLFVDAVHPAHAARPVGCWPRLSRQCALSSRQAGAGLARPAGVPDQLHFIPSYCPHLNPTPIV